MGSHASSSEGVGLIVNNFPCKIQVIISHVQKTVPGAVGALLGTVWINSNTTLPLIQLVVRSDGFFGRGEGLGSRRWTCRRSCWGPMAVLTKLRLDLTVVDPAK